MVELKVVDLTDLTVMLMSSMLQPKWIRAVVARLFGSLLVIVLKMWGT